MTMLGLRHVRGRAFQAACTTAGGYFKHAASLLTLLGLGFSAVALTAGAEDAPKVAPGSVVWMHGCFASVSEHKGPPRYPYPTITSVTVRCPGEESAVLRAAGSDLGITLRWVTATRLVVSVPAGTTVLWRATPTGEGKRRIEYEPPLRESDIVYGELPRSQWPSTCESAARLVIAELPAEGRQIIRQLSPDELGEMRLFWGVMLSRHLALYRGNSRLLESCGGAQALAGIDVVNLIVKELRAEQYRGGAQE